MFAGVTGAKPVTVKVPSGATGYGQSPANTGSWGWGNNFRRGDSWSPNANIELTIEYVVAEVADVADETAQ
jgi:hypothetical protein